MRVGYVRGIRLKRLSYGSRCWWCGGSANSREHRFKRTDLVREYGHGPYIGDNAIVRGREDRLTPVQGPNSTVVKFAPSLCQLCNTTRSQPFDRAYDKLIDHVAANEVSVQQSGLLKLRDVYGPTWRRSRYDLVRYYVKHIGCRLAEAEVEVPLGLREFLDGETKLVGLNLQLVIRDDVVALIEHSANLGMNAGGLWLGDLACMMSRSTGDITEFSSHLGYRWLWLYYSYGDSNRKLGAFSRNYVRLGRAYVFDPDEVRAGPEQIARRLEDDALSTGHGKGVE